MVGHNLKAKDFGTRFSRDFGNNRFQSFGNLARENLSAILGAETKSVQNMV